MIQPLLLHGFLSICYVHEAGGRELTEREILRVEWRQIKGLHDAKMSLKAILGKYEEDK